MVICEEEVPKSREVLDVYLSYTFAIRFQLETKSYSTLFILLMLLLYVFIRRMCICLGFRVSILSIHRCTPHIKSYMTVNQAMLLIKAQLKSETCKWFVSSVNMFLGS